LCYGREIKKLNNALFKPIINIYFKDKMFIIVLFLLESINAQTSSPTTLSPTTAAAITGNTCSACTTSSCVYYRHAYSPTVQEVVIGCASPTLSPVACIQSGTFGVGSTGLYSFGGASTQVNIASSSPTGTGATGKINIGANSGTATSQEINVGKSSSGIITIGGSIAAPSPTRQQIKIGGVQTPSTTESTDIIFNDRYYLNNIGLFKIQPSPTTPSLAPVSYPNSNGFHQAIGLPYKPTPTPTPTVSYNSVRFVAPSTINVGIQNCPTGAPTSNNAGDNILFSQNNDCIVFQQPGIYQVCIGGISSNVEPTAVFLWRASCRGTGGVGFICNPPTPTPTPSCTNVPVATPSTFPATIGASTPGTSTCGPVAYTRIPFGAKGTTLPHQCVTVNAPSSTSDIDSAPVAYILTYYSTPTSTIITQDANIGGMITVSQIGTA
jgi:hypothetical protein